MSRDWQLYIDDMLTACQKVRRYVGEMTLEEFLRDERSYDAVLRNLEIIGEAAKQLPPDVKTSYPDIEWKRIAGFRDIIAHAYFGIDDHILWSIITGKIPQLLEALSND